MELGFWNPEFDPLLPREAEIYFLENLAFNISTHPYYGKQMDSLKNATETIGLPYECVRKQLDSLMSAD